MNTKEQNANWQRISADKRISLRKAYNEAVHNSKHDRESLRLSWKGQADALVKLFGDNIINN